MKTNIRNIALFAHVDAGKTTVTENFLFANGNIRLKGNVNKGTSKTDFLDIEKEKGISVRAACVSFNREGVNINLIDTPGHTDFSSETKRALLAIDGAVLILSAVEGVQSYTETLWETLRKLKIPTVIFINKIDRAGADTEQVLNEMKKYLSKDIMQIQNTINEGNNKANIINVLDNIENQNKEDRKIYENFVETIVEKDEELLERYFDDERIEFKELEQIMINNTQACKLFPVLFGIAKNEIGTEELCDAIVKYLPPPKNTNNGLQGIIYKIEHNKTLGKLAHIRLYSGKIDKRDIVYNASQDVYEKVTQIKKIYTEKYQDIDKAIAGDISVVLGLSKAKAGDMIGKIKKRKKDLLISEIPLLTLKVDAKKEANSHRLLEAFRKLSDQDPSLNMRWIDEQKELHINIKGKIQIEILKRVLCDEFDIDANFEKPVIIYKETPTKTAFGYVRYWMPKPCWAIMRFKIEPGKRGSGVIYKSEVSVNDIKQRYQNQVEKAIPRALKQGIKGWQITDIIITLTEGEDHVVHTHPPDFTIATPMGIMNALVNSGTELLEPILNFRITAPEEILGAIASDLNKMRASFGNPEFENEKVILKGKIPAATSLDYHIKLASLTGGKGKINTNFDSYMRCAPEEGRTTDYKGISPLDRSRYILHARNAL